MAVSREAVPLSRSDAHDHLTTYLGPAGFGELAELSASRLAAIVADDPQAVTGGFRNAAVGGARMAALVAEAIRRLP